MKGVIHSPQDWKHQYACFKCDHCRQVHCLYIDLNKSEEVEGLHIWKYRYIHENTIELTPSYDNSKFCGWHSSYTWQIELVSLEVWADFINGDKDI